MTRRFGVLAFAVTSALALSACGGGGASQSTTTAAPAKSDSSQMTVASGDFGVPECDDYMKKYVACVDSKVPDASRQALKQALDQTKAAWKQAAATPGGKAALATGCTQALATAKQALGMYGCQW
jgi:hypothetical protein